MTTYTELLPDSKTEKHRGFKFHKSDNAYSPVCGTVVIESPKRWCEYTLAEFPTGWDGRGFRLDKIAGGTDAESESYDVFIGRGGLNVTCDCKGFTYGRGRKCKHIEAILSCIENSWL